MAIMPEWYVEWEWETPTLVHCRCVMAPTYHVARPVCGEPTRDGTPCRNRVSLGGRCRHHSAGELDTLTGLPLARIEDVVEAER